MASIKPNLINYTPQPQRNRTQTPSASNNLPTLLTADKNLTDISCKALTLSDLIRQEVNKHETKFKTFSNDEKIDFEKLRDQEAYFPKFSLHKVLYLAYQIILVNCKMIHPEYDEKRKISETINFLRHEVEKIQQEAPNGYPKRKSINESHLLSGIEQAEIALIELSDTIQKKQVPFLSKLPANQLWQLFIDANRSPLYSYLFDLSEPGYLGGVFNCFNAALTFEGPLTVSTIIQFHEVAMQNILVETVYAFDIFQKIIEAVSNAEEPFKNKLEKVDKLIKENTCRLISGKVSNLTGSLLNKPECGLTDKEHGVTLTPLTSTKKGIAELEEKLQKDSKNHIPYIRLESTQFPDSPMLKNYGTREERHQFLSELTDRFNQELQLTITPEQKQRLIIQYVQNFDQFHPFDDGNIRICAFILLNTLLLRESLCPVIWENPNILDGYSLDECCIQVQKGQERFKSLIKA